MASFAIGLGIVSAVSAALLLFDAHVLRSPNTKTANAVREIVAWPLAGGVCVLVCGGMTYVFGV